MAQKGRKRNAGASEAVQASKRTRIAEGTPDDQVQALPPAETDQGIYQPDDGKIPEASRNLASSQIPYLKSLAADFKKDTYAKAFRETVIQGGDELLAKLDDIIRTRENDDQSFNSKFCHLVSDTLAQTGEQTAPQLPLNLQHGRDASSLYIRSSRSLDTSLQLLNMYNGLADRDVASSRSAKVREELTQETQYAKDVILAGRAAIHWDVVNLLGETSQVSGKPELGKSVTLNRTVDAMLNEGREDNGIHGEPWGEVAIKAKKGYKRFQKTTH